MSDESKLLRAEAARCGVITLPQEAVIAIADTLDAKDAEIARLTIQLAQADARNLNKDVRLVEECRERDALREKLKAIEELGGKTILGPTDEECAEAACEPNLRWAHSVGANKAFNQAAEIARSLRSAPRSKPPEPYEVLEGPGGGRCTPSAPSACSKKCGDEGECLRAMGKFPIRSAQGEGHG